MKEVVAVLTFSGDFFVVVSASRSAYSGPQSSYALRSLCNGAQETDSENERLAFQLIQILIHI